MTVQEAIDKYGPIVDGKWANEAHWMESFLVPGEFYNHLINTYTGSPTTKIYMNKDMHSPLLLAFKNLKDAGRDRELHSFDGCFVIRSVRGYPNTPSAHSYGLAIDFNAKDNPLGGESSWTDDFVKCFKSAGFYYGGEFHRRDAMHFALVNW